MRHPEDELALLREAGLLRRLRTVSPRALPCIEVDGGELLNFSSNDYLGLSQDDELREAAHAAIDRFGTGSTASRLISGSLQIHHDLEDYLAELKGTEAALTFSSGYAAAIGTLTSILRKGDTVILDKLCHASLIDGARQSGARLRVFPHNNLSKLERILAGTRDKSPADARVLVVTESVFSMDGDRAPLAEIVDLAERFGALVMIDEAHAIGVLGPTGQGLLQELGLQQRVTLQMGTLGKGVGSAGGYIAGERCWIDLLVNSARSLIYSTAPTPAQAGASLCGLQIIASKRGAGLRETLWNNLARFGSLRGSTPESAIVPVLVGESVNALQAAESLAQAGILAPAIRFPTVPRGTARLRITLSAAHRAEDLATLDRALRACGLGTEQNSRP